MIIDWTHTENAELQDVADGMADAAGDNLGLPFALLLIAIERTEARGLNRQVLIDGLREVVAEYLVEGARST